MLDLTKKILPRDIEVRGSFYQIKTDFRLWIRFGQLLENEETSLEDLKYLFKGKIPENIGDALPSLLNFYSSPRELPRASSDSSNEKILDFSKDADYIYSAFMQVYRIDLLKADLHYYEFLALLGGIRDTKLNDIMSFRSYDPNDKTEYKDFMIKQKKAWALPSRVSEQVQKDLDEFNKTFK